MREPKYHFRVGGKIRMYGGTSISVNRTVRFELTDYDSRRTVTFSCNGSIVDYRYVCVLFLK